MPLVQADRLLRPQPDAFVHPLGDDVCIDPSVSQVQPVSVGLDDIFVPGDDRAARRRRVDPRRHRVGVVKGDGRVVRTERASAGSVAVKPRDIAVELKEALAVEARRLPDPSGPKSEHSARPGLSRREGK